MDNTRKPTYLQEREPVLRCDTLKMGDRMSGRTALFRKFRTALAARNRDANHLRSHGRELQEILERVAITDRWRLVPRHLVRLWDDGQGKPQYAVLRYLGRVGSREYFLDYVESSVEHHVSWGGILYVANASRRRPVRVTLVPPEETDEKLIRRILGAVERTGKRRLQPFRIPRGYYPYGYFRNWVSERWRRRKHHTIHRSGILTASTMRDACRQLIRQWTTSESIDSLYVLTGNGYVSLEPVLDGEWVGLLSPEFFKRGTLEVRRNRRRA